MGQLECESLARSFLTCVNFPMNKLRVFSATKASRSVCCRSVTTTIFLSSILLSSKTSENRILIKFHDYCNRIAEVYPNVKKNL